MVKDNITYRKCNENDDFPLIAKYIHLTDLYIYPSISKSPIDEFFTSLILKCSKDKTNLFNLNNLFLALDDGKIIGVLCAIKCGKKYTFIENLDLTNDEKSRLNLSNEGYFMPLINESESFDGYNVTNICIDENYRGQNIGEGLLGYYLELVNGSVVHLDVIADNIPAIKLYQKLGFQIESEYLGFSGSEKTLKCYHMKRS